MKSKSLLVLVAAVVTGACGCGGSSPASRIPFPSGPHPIPSINSVNPTAAVAGGPGLTLNVSGSNFVAGSVVRWNGSDRPTTVTPDVYICPPGYTSANQCTGYVVAANSATVQIPSSDIAEAGTAEITVFSPAPGGGTSNTVTFTIAAHGMYPSSVTVDPAGKFAYVTNSDPGNVSTYAINTDGTLAFKGTIAAGSNPLSIAVDRSSKFAYVANYGSGDVSTYVINTDGTLTFKGTIAAGTGPASLAVDPSGKFAYVANQGSGSNDGSVSMYTIDTTTGALMPIGTIPAGTVPVSVVVDPSGKFTYVANLGAASDYGYYPGSVSMYTIDTTTGALLPNGEINETSTTMSPSSVAVDPSGRFAYEGNSGGVSMYSIDTTTGKLTSIGTEAGAGVLSLAVHPSGNFAYASADYSVSPPHVSVYTLNAATGVLASNGNAPTERSPRSIAIAPSGKFAYVANNDSHSISMYTIDAVTGTLTLIGTIGT